MELQFAKIRLSNFSEIGFPEMAGALAHEIKNPAAVALAHVNLMRQETAPSEDVLEAHLNHIEQAIMDICDLVQEMLFAIYNHADPYELDLQDTVQEMLDTYRAAWPHISFSFDSNERLICFGNESSLRMVFSNLLKNSVEAVDSMEYGQISISTQNKGGFQNIAIYNNGIFEEPANKPYGNGLGIAICRHILQQLGGHLQIYGQPGVEGCTAMISIPV